MTVGSASSPVEVGTVPDLAGILLLELLSGLIAFCAMHSLRSC